MMEFQDHSQLIQTVLGDERTLALFITVGVGFFAGKLVRSMAKIAIYFAGVFILILLGLQYVGLMSIDVNYAGMTEILNWVFLKSQNLGLAEHLFFWIPFLYSIRKSRILPAS